jgi:hypothetical protein
MSTSKIRIAYDISQEIRYKLPNITDSETPPHLLKYSYFEGYGMVGFVEHGQESEHHDLQELIIRVVGDSYYSTYVSVPRDNSDYEWDVEDEEGEPFVIWTKVVPASQTRYIWKTKE